MGQSSKINVVKYGRFRRVSGPVRKIINALYKYGDQTLSRTLELYW